MSHRHFKLNLSKVKLTVSHYSSSLIPSQWMSPPSFSGPGWNLSSMSPLPHTPLWFLSLKSLSYLLLPLIPSAFTPGHWYFLPRLLLTKIWTGFLVLSLFNLHSKAAWVILLKCKSDVNSHCRGSQVLPFFSFYIPLSLETHAAPLILHPSSPAPTHNLVRLDALTMFSHTPYLSLHSSHFFVIIVYLSC